MGQIGPDDDSGHPSSRPVRPGLRAYGTRLDAPAGRFLDSCTMGRTRAGKWAGKFAAAGRGIARAVRTESSFRVHLPVAAGVIAAGAYFKLEPAEWAISAIAIGGVLAAELLNSAIEQLARGPGLRRHPRLRDALDMGAGAVLLASIAAVVTGAAIFLPRILSLSAIP